MPPSELNELANRVTFRFRGRPEDEGFIRVGEFARFLEDVLKALHRVEGDVAPRSGTIYRLRRLETGSAVIEVEAVPRRNRLDRSRVVVGTFVAGLRALQTGAPVPEALHPSTLAAFGKLVEPLRTGARLEVLAEGAPFELSPALAERIAQLAAHDFAATGSVTGAVDALNVHEDLVFFLYPGVLPGKVACYFSRELLDEVRQAVKRHVTVVGRLLYQRGSALPHRVDVDELHIHPPEEELPAGVSLAGIAPHLTGGLESTDFVRRLRDAEA